MPLLPRFRGVGGCVAFVAVWPPESFKADTDEPLAQAWVAPTERRIGGVAMAYLLLREYLSGFKLDSGASASWPGSRRYREALRVRNACQTLVFPRTDLGYPTRGARGVADSTTESCRS